MANLASDLNLPELAERFERQKTYFKHQLNGIVDNLFGFLLAEVSSSSYRICPPPSANQIRSFELPKPNFIGPSFAPLANPFPLEPLHDYPQSNRINPSLFPSTNQLPLDRQSSRDHPISNLIGPSHFPSANHLSPESSRDHPKANPIGPLLIPSTNHTSVNQPTNENCELPNCPDIPVKVEIIEEEQEICVSKLDKQEASPFSSSPHERSTNQTRIFEHSKSINQSDRFDCSNCASDSNDYEFEDEDLEGECDCEDCLVKIEDDDDEDEFNLIGEDEAINGRPIKRQRTDQSESNSNSNSTVQLINGAPRGYFKVDTLALKCYRCDEMFQTRELANLHLKVVHRAGLMRCRVIGCEQTFEHGRALRRHIDESHRGLNNFQCEQCTLSYTSHACLSNHYRSHHEEGVFTCSQLDCQFTAPLRVEVHRHTRSGHRNTSKPFNTISTTTTTSSSLFIVPKRFSCPIEGCGLSFDSSSGLRQHGRTHSDVRPYLCVYPDCGGNTAFKVKSHAIRHIQEVHFQIPRLGRGRNAEMIEPNDNRDPMMYLQVINELLQ